MIRKANQEQEKLRGYEETKIIRGQRDERTRKQRGVWNERRVGEKQVRSYKQGMGAIGNGHSVRVTYQPSKLKK